MQIFVSLVPLSPTSPTLSITIKMAAMKNKTPKTSHTNSSNLQMNLNDLNKNLQKKKMAVPSTLSSSVDFENRIDFALESSEVDRTFENTANTSDSLATTSTSAFSPLEFNKTKDFGDFQILSNSPEKAVLNSKQPPRRIFSPKMVDV